MLDVDREVVGISLNIATTDEAALAVARAWLAKHPAVEVWNGTRVVGTLISAGAGQRRRLPLGAAPSRGCSSEIA